jgi:hypothetical protein
MKNSCPYGVIEFKGGKYSPLQGSRQAATYGSHFAIGLLKHGLLREQVIVPTYTYTGMQIQFGATIVLKPSFPVYMTTNKVLDMSDASERRLAIAYIRKASKWVDRLCSLPRSATLVPIIAMELDTSAYRAKILSDAVVKRGFQLFSDFNGDLGQGIEHWGRVLNVFFADPEVRPYVAFPLAIRSPNSTNDEEHHIIIYKDLCAEGYRIGCPHRMEESELFGAFLAEYRRIVNLVYRAVVIHCDLYLSNVMWRLRSGAATHHHLVDIVIIDWDCSHCLIEGCFHPNVREALHRHQPSRGAEFGTAFDDRYVDVLYSEYVESERH